jgi:hypothetical protein
MTQMLMSWRVRPRAASLVVAGFMLALVSPTVAQAAKRKVGVSVNGMPAGPVRGAISDVLKHHGFEATSPDLSSDADDAIAAAAKQSKLSAVVVGEVREGGKRLKLRVYGATGDLISEGSWHEAGGPKKLANSVERTLWSRVGGALSKAHPAGGGGDKAERAEREVAQQAEEAPRSKKEAAPVEETPTYSRSSESDTPREKSEASDDGEAPRKRGKKKRSSDGGAEAVARKSGGEESSSGPAGRALDLGVSSRFVMRSLSWTGASTLSTYSLSPPAPSLGLNVSWYPAAHAMSGWPSNLGVYLGVEYTPGLSSQRKDAMTGAIAKFPTQESDYAGGVQGRLLLGPVEGALQLGGGQHGFIFRSGAGADRGTLAGLPDVKYTYFRAGLDARIKLPSNLSLQLGGGYRAVLGAGNVNYLLEASGFLPNAKVSGFDGMAAIGYRFLPVLEGRGGFDLRRYVITGGNNASMTTGGVDQYLAFWVQLAVVLDGSGAAAGGSGDDEEAEAAPPPKASKKREKAESDEDESGE